MIRVLDFIFSLLGLIILLPFFIFIGLAIMIDTPGGIFYLQERVGKLSRGFLLIKFRTMQSGSDKQGGLTVGAHDSRITRTGLFLRKYKIDELPQLINVLQGEMSLVGPRPELRKYVTLYSEDQKKVLCIRPGITDIASLEYINENELLGTSSDPERTYIEQIMPAKLELNRKYLNEPTIGNYFRIICQTFKKILR